MAWASIIYTHKNIICRISMFDLTVEFVRQKTRWFSLKLHCTKCVPVGLQ